MDVSHAIGSVLNFGSAAAKGDPRSLPTPAVVKLTDESAKALKLGNAMKGSTDSVSRAIVTTSKGKITNILKS